MFRFPLLLLLLCTPARAEDGSLLLWRPEGFDFPLLIARRAGESGPQAAERYLSAVEAMPELAPFAKALRETGPAEFSTFAPGAGLSVAGQALASSGEMNDLAAHAARMHRTLDPLLARARDQGLATVAVIRLPGASAGLPAAEANAFERSFGAAFDGYVIPGSASDVAPALYGQANRFAEQPNLTLGREVVQTTKAYLKHSLGKLYGVCFGMEAASVGQGASLVQDLPAELGSTIHAGPGNTPVSHTIAPATKDPASPFARIFGNDQRLRISWSDHHESVLVPRNSAALRVGAVSEEAKPVTEGVEFLGPSGKLRGFGIQFHAERDENPEITKRVYDVLFEEMEKSRRERTGGPGAEPAGCPGLFRSLAR